MSSPGTEDIAGLSTSLYPGIYLDSKLIATSARVVISGLKGKMKSGLSSLEKVQKISDQSTPNYQSAVFRSKEWGLNTLKVEPSLRLRSGDLSAGRL